MKHLWIIGAAAVLLSTSAMAADTPAAGDEHHWTPPHTRQEAIERTQKRLDKLKSMTDDEWKKQSEERHEKWEAHRKQHASHSDGGTPPATNKQ